MQCHVQTSFSRNGLPTPVSFAGIIKRSSFVASSHNLTSPTLRAEVHVTTVFGNLVLSSGKNLLRIF